MNIEPLKHRTLSGALLDELRQAILSGRYPAGSQLRQDALASAYGVSRIPIREVLLQLEAEGLVDIVPRRGAVVSEISAEEIVDVFELRALLEPRLFRASVPLLNAEDYERIEAVQAEYVAAAAGRVVDRYGELNSAFHLAFAVRARMPRTEQIVVSLMQASDRYTRVQLSTPEALARAMHEHAELIRLCRMRAFDAATAYLVAHIEGVRNDLLAVIEARSAGQAGSEAEAM